jgi:hypothetical protein
MDPCKDTWRYPERTAPDPVIFQYKNGHPMSDVSGCLGLILTLFLLYRHQSNGRRINEKYVVFKVLV